METDDNKYLIKIGEREVDSFKVQTLVLSGPRQPIGLLDFIIDMRKSKVFNDLDLKDDVYAWRKSDNQKIFGGYVDELFYNGNLAALLCRGGNKDYEHAVIRGYRFLNTSTTKISYFTARLVFKKSKIQFDTQLLRELDLRSRPHVVIIPVQNLKINGKFSTGNVTFYSPSIFEEDRVISESKAGQEDVDWASAIPRARVIVESTNFYDAILEGYEAISTAIDLITLRSDLSFTKLHGSQARPSFSNVKHLSRLTLLPKVFCKEQKASDACFYDLRIIRETEMEFNGTPENYFKPISKLLDVLAHKRDSELTKDQRLIARSIRWLRLSIHTVDPTTKLLDLWVSLEFATQGLSSRRFTEEQIIALKEHIQRMDFGAIRLSENQIDAIKGKFDMLNDAPLLEKISHFIRDNNIPFTNSEFELVKQARKKRNDIEHGKGNVEIEKEELENLQSLIERIILTRASKL